MIRAVVDTNLFVSGLILERGYPFLLLEEWQNASFVLIISQLLRAELETVLRRSKFSRNLSDDKLVCFFRLLDTISIMVFPSHNKLPLQVRDPKDEMVLATAVAGNADYLVTGDSDLLVLNGHSKLKNLKIVLAKEFLGLLT